VQILNRLGAAPLTSADLVRTYERHTHQQRALVRRSAVITQRLAVLTSSLRRLLADDHFVTLLRAEGMRTMPEYLASHTAAHS
jgi:ParB family chromosome partitioning protein